MDARHFKRLCRTIKPAFNVNWYSLHLCNDDFFHQKYYLINLTFFTLIASTFDVSVKCALEASTRAQIMLSIAICRLWADAENYFFCVFFWVMYVSTWNFSLSLIFSNSRSFKYFCFLCVCVEQCFFIFYRWLPFFSLECDFFWNTISI